MAQVGLTFNIESPAIDETIRLGEDPISYVERMSQEKLGAISEKCTVSEDSVVVCADTIVVLDDVILGKPSADVESIEMLTALSGRTHHVFTSVAVGNLNGLSKTCCVKTVVEFRALHAEEIAAYCATSEGNDKAGSYAIQGIGAMFVKAIQGSYSNVVGLPLMEVVSILREFGINPLSQR